MKLLGSTESKISRDKNDEHIPHLELTKVVLVHFNIINNYCQQDSRIFYTLFFINHLVLYLKFHQ